MDFSTFSRHLSLLSIASCWFSKSHPVSAQKCCRKILVGRTTLAYPFKGVHRRRSLISSSLILRQYQQCLVRLFGVVLVMGDRWPYSCSFVGCCFENLFNIALSILAQFPSSFFSLYAVLASLWCPHIVDLTRTLFEKKKLNMPLFCYYELISASLSI